MPIIGRAAGLWCDRAEKGGTSGGRLGTLFDLMTLNGVESMLYLIMMFALSGASPHQLSALTSK
jgi:hypothetical protein